MKKILLEVNQDEKGRILEMHKKATSNNYLITEAKDKVATKIPVGSKTIKLNVSRKATYDTGSSDPALFIGDFVADIMTKINEDADAKTMFDAGNMVLMSVTLGASSSNNWGKIVTGYNMGQNNGSYVSLKSVVTPTTDSDLTYYNKNLTLAQQRGDTFVGKLAAKLAAKGIDKSSNFTSTVKAFVTNTGGKSDTSPTKDTETYSLPGQFITASITFGYKETVFKIQFKEISDIKSNFVLYGTYFCSGANGVNRNTAEQSLTAAVDTYKPMCDAQWSKVKDKTSKVEAFKFKNYLSVFEIKWQPGVLKDPWTSPVLRWEFTWGDNGKGGYKITSVKIKYVEKKYVPQALFPEGPSSVDDPKLKYMMGLNDGDTVGGGKIYKTFIAPYI